MNRTRWTLGLGILSLTVLIGLGTTPSGQPDKSPDQDTRPTIGTVALETTTTTTSTTSTTTSTTTTLPAPTTTLSPEQIAEEQRITRQMEIDEARMMYGRCGEWHDLAMQVGWDESEWETLSTVLYTESRCQPDAWNGHDAGLTQINQIHREWLAELGYTHPDDMFDPALNLWFAHRLYESREEIGKCGWKPWSEPCK